MNADLPYSGELVLSIHLGSKKLLSNKADTATTEQKENLYFLDKHKARQISNSFSDLLTKAQSYAIPYEKKIV